MPPVADVGARLGVRLLAQRRWLRLAVLVGNGVLQAAGAVVAALAVERAFGLLGVVGGASPVDVAVVVAMMSAAAVGNAWLRARERVDAEVLGQGYVHALRVRLLDRLLAMSPRAVGARSQGSTALRFVGDLGAVRKWVSLGLSRLAVAGTMTVGTLVALSLVDVVLAGVVALAAALGTLGAWREGTDLRETTRVARRRRSRVAGRVTEVIGALGVVQANGAVDRERRRMRRQSRRLRDAMVERARRIGRLRALGELTGSSATMFLVTAALVLGAPAPRVAAAMTVVGLLVPQLRGLARCQEYWQGRRVALDAIARFLDRPAMLSEPAQPRALPDGPGRLELRGASLGPVRDVSVVARPGRTVAVVGPNGAGKSTLLAMVARLVDLDAGAVVLDGEDTAAIALDDVRAAVGMAAPDLPLMRGSLRRNLTYRTRDVEDAQLRDVVRRCDLVGLLVELDNGMDHRISEGGANLSSGQQQRVQLARAVMGGPRLLLLDEADANLDATTTAILDRVLDTHDGTALVVTHRRERVVAADDVWCLVDGRLVEAGPVDEVLAARGPTAELFGLVGADANSAA